jgi:myosin heavy subunit
VKDLRRVLEELTFEKERTDIKANRCKELEEQVMELRQTNRSLEDKIARLCEAPFISDAFGKTESIRRLEELAKERDDIQGKYEHLQEALRTNYSALTSLKQELAKLREAKEIAENTVVELRSKYQEMESGNLVLHDKLRLFSGDEGINLEDLEKALYVVKRRGEAVTKLDFLEDTEVDGLLTIPSLKRKLQDVQLLNLNLTRETERLENMLRLQTDINKDLHDEIQGLVRVKDKDKQELLLRAENFEQLAGRRLEKIHQLEAQIREFVYTTAKQKKGKYLETVNELDESISGSEVDGQALLGDLMDEKKGDIKPDDNMLEVWIKGAVIKAGVLGPGVSTFIVVDFFDYESQTTALASSYNPLWDFAATYKLTVDDFLLRYLATDVITLELNMVRFK